MMTLLPILYQLFAGLLATYFVSRLTMRFPLLRANFAGLLQAHAISATIILVGIGMLRAPLADFTLGRIIFLVSAQLFWLLIDRIRRNLPGTAAEA
ncbi:hypothetical protein [Novosphingobium lentum]|uniref:hypothetical protein n=1 Tax=Novosphingobium lentum TaxID=145287 RepID=UPI0008358C36|nr:hypothetical protein [Novosphingobium lentum]